MLLIRRKNSNGKYQNDAITSSNLEKKLAQKTHILTLYRISYSEDLGILDLRSIILSIGVHTVKICDFRSTFFGRLEEVIASFCLILLSRNFPSDQKHSSGNCIKFPDVKYLVLNVDNRGEKKEKVIS